MKSEPSGIEPSANSSVKEDLTDRNESVRMLRAPPCPARGATWLGSTRDNANTGSNIVTSAISVMDARLQAFKKASTSILGYRRYGLPICPIKLQSVAYG